MEVKRGNQVRVRHPSLRQGQTSEESGSGTGSGGGTAEGGEEEEEEDEEEDDDEEGDDDGEVEEEFDGSEEPSSGRGSESMSSLGQPTSPSRYPLGTRRIGGHSQHFRCINQCVDQTRSLHWLSCT